METIYLVIQNYYLEGMLGVSGAYKTKEKAVEAKNRLQKQSNENCPLMNNSEYYEVQQITLE